MTPAQLRSIYETLYVKNQASCCIRYWLVNGSSSKLYPEPLQKSLIDSIEEGDPDAKHNYAFKYASDEDSASDCDTPVHLYAVVDWELLPTGLGSINAIYRLDNSRKYFTSLREILHLVTRADLMTNLWRVRRFSAKKAEGVGNELTTAVQLIAFLKKQISDSKRPKVHEWYVVPTGRVVVPTGRYVVPAGKVIIIVSTGRLSLVPTSRVLSPGSDNDSDDASVSSEPTISQQKRNIQPQIITTVSNNNAKFPYLKKDEYEVWAMKMEYWITNNDMNIWKVIQNSNSLKRTGRDYDGGVIILPPTTADEHIAVQKESNARTTLLQSIPDDHVTDFHYMDDARDIWNAVKARFGGNVESKKMRKSMLKQEFSEFRISKAEGFRVDISFLKQESLL
ncbi:hypothetical protein Tco_0967318 [Tanacetum coccineum]